MEQNNISNLLKNTSLEIVRSPEKWCEFLDTAAHNHKYSFVDQLLIFAQKPDAIACANAEIWDKKLNRVVNLNSTPIYLADYNGEPTSSSIVFDVSDTTGNPVYLWKVHVEMKETLRSLLCEHHGLNTHLSLSEAIEEIAKQATESAYPKALSDLLGLNSEFSNDLLYNNVEGVFSRTLKDIIQSSITYMLLSRCDLASEYTIDLNKFENIPLFNTAQSISVLGSIVSNSSKLLLNEISLIVKTLEKTLNLEKNLITDKEAIKNEQRDESIHREVRTDEEDLSEGTQGRSVHRNDDRGQIGDTSFGDESASPGNDGTTNHEDERSSASDRETQNGESNALGSENEQHSLGGRGNSTERVDLPLIEGEPFTSEGVDYFHLNHEKCELIKFSPALKEHRIEIAEYFKEHPNSKERGEYLLRFFNEHPQELVLSNGVTAGYKAYQNRLHLWRGSYDNRERDCYEPWWQVSEYISGMLLLHTWDDSLFPPEEEQIERAKAENENKLYLPQEAIDCVLAGGSGVSEGRLRIYAQFAKNESATENVAFLKDEYGIGGRSDAIPGTGYWEQHDSKGISIEDHYVTDTKMVLSWSYVNKRIKELINSDKYLTPEEKEEYPAWHKKTTDTAKRWEITREFRNIIHDYNDFQEQLGDNDDKLNTYDLVEYSSQFAIGNKISYVNHAEGVFVLPVMREAMNKIIAENTHLTDRCESVLKLLQSEAAQYLDPAYDEQNPPPVVPKEYQYHLGDIVHLGVDEYEILELNDEDVTVFEVKFPLFNTTYSKEEFNKLLAESSLNDHLLVDVTNVVEKIETVVDKATESNKEVDVLCEILTTLKLDDIEISYENDELFASDGETIWRGKEFYEFLNNDVFVYQDEGATVNAISEELYADFVELAKKYNILVQDNRYNPYWREYSAIKSDNPDSIVLYQIGDFLEIMGNDAYVVADELELIVTKRNKHAENVPLVGFPLHVVEKYTDKLIKNNHSLIIASLENEERVLKKLVPVDEEALVEQEPFVEQSSSDFNENIESENKSELEDEPNEHISIKQEKVRPNLLLPEIPSYKRNDFTITDDALGVGTPSERYENNVAAIRLLKEIEGESRLATPEEQQVLSKYVGWGGLADCFDDRNKKYEELKSLLSEEEYIAARESTLTAFYTPPAVIRAMYNVLENINFKRGNILEPSCGIGNFIGMLPNTLKESKIYGVELDDISGRIARQLYQNSSIAVQGYEKVDVPDSFFDCAIGNVPFGQFKINDKRYNQNNFLIHDYFFAKTLDKVRPGGIIAFISSKGTLDKANPAVRKYIAQRADLLGAIRLPNNTFKAAAGTEVTSDIIFLQKRERIIDVEPDWVHLDCLVNDETGEILTYPDGKPVEINSYFNEHPEMVLGEMKVVSGPHGPETSCIPYSDESLDVQLNRAIQTISENVSLVESDFDEIDLSRDIPADPNVRNFSFTEVDGVVYFRENSVMRPVQTNQTAEKRIKGLIELRELVRSLIDAQLNNEPDSEISFLQQELNRVYDKFTSKYGLINSRGNSIAFSDDSSYYLLCSLEHLDKEGNLERKADMFTKRTIRPVHEELTADSSIDALAISIGEKAKVDLEYMKELTGFSFEKIIDDLKGLIFANPEKTDENGIVLYEPADEYLSGDVKEKLRIARVLAEQNPDKYAFNVEALEKVQPEPLTASEISVRLGATWVPVDVYQSFMIELLQTPHYFTNSIKINYIPYTGHWDISHKTYDSWNIKAREEYGSKRASAYRILEDSLNLKDTVIYDTIEDDNGKKKQIVNKNETMIAQQKQQAIKDAFVDWVWQDSERRQRLVNIYNEKFNSIKLREFNGEHILFHGMNPEITLMKHQQDAIAHILYGGNTLLAHSVGAGKTYEMVAAAMESKRLGLCHKSMFVVPNHLTVQWAAEFLRLYPSANILVASKKDFETKNRKKFCARIATGDYDAIIIGHSQFEKIPLSVERQKRTLQSQLDEILEGIVIAKEESGDRATVKQLERSRKSIQDKLDKLNDEERKDDVVNFEELGVDRLFVDEAHYFKNLFLYTKMQNIAGISQTEAKKSTDMFMKTQYMDEMTENKGTVFATGTPVSNSMSEIYTMQRYLQHDALKSLGLQHFDSWASTFGETINAVELAPEGTGYRSKTRFARFYNLPELMTIFKNIADIKTADELDLDVPDANYHIVSVEPSDEQREIVSSFSERAKRIRNGGVDPTEDNMLKITNDGRNLGLDQRCYISDLPDFEGSKVNACIKNIYDIWNKHKDNKLTQLVFSDLSTPRNNGEFNVYDDIKNKLIDLGIPENEIAFIHDAKTEVQKETLFADVRSGDVRVLIGSTQKMGAGTNVQNKLVALHDLDCPWRPADLEQRSGRIIRQGNNQDEVEIYRYVTKDTFDAYMWQLVENKQKFISQIMTSKTPVRVAEDIDSTALSYAEIKALATGNPLIKEKMDLDIKVSKLKLLKNNFLNRKYAMEDSLIHEIPDKIKSVQAKIEGYKKDIELVNTTHTSDENAVFPLVINNITYNDKDTANNAIRAALKGFTSTEKQLLGEYRGFQLLAAYDNVYKTKNVYLKGSLTYKLGTYTDGFPGIGRLNAIINPNKMSELLTNANYMLENLQKQKVDAEEFVKKTFAQEDELREANSRLNELNALLNTDSEEVETQEDEIDSIETDCVDTNDKTIKDSLTSAIESAKKQVVESSQKNYDHEERWP